MKKTMIALATIAVAVVMASGPVSADGAKTGPYGEVVKKPGVEKPREEVTHKPVDAGFEDINFAAMASLMAVGGVVLIGMSKLTRSAYWLE